MNYSPWPGVSLSETPVDWAKVFGSGKLSAKSTANVDRRRKTEGKDFSTFRGISRKSDALTERSAPGTIRRIRKMGPGSGSTLDEHSKCGQIRAFLRNGPMTRAEICAAVGIRADRISAYLKNDIKQGRILKIVREGELQQFALAEAA